MAFDQPARQSMIPSIVPVDRVINAMALMSATQNMMRIVGVSLGGFVYAVFGAGGAFGTIAAIYVGAVVFTWLLDVPTHDRPESTGLVAMGRGLVEGVRFALSHAAVRGVLILSLIYFTFGMSYMQVFLPLFADRVLEIGSGGFGLMGSATGVGALIAAIGIARRQPTQLGAILPILVTCFGAVMVAFSLSTYLSRPAGLLVPFALILLAGALQTSFFSLSRSLMLQASPEHMRGRVLSLLSLDRAFMTGGAAAAGVLAAAVGVQLAQIAYGAICLVCGAAVLAFATRSRTEKAPNSGDGVYELPSSRLGDR
jgi:predicted MFS family arabinose efflux permease